MEFPLVSAAKVQTKKHRVREIVVSALQGQPGNTDFEATILSTKSNISLARCFFHLFILSMTKKWKHM
jgi:hypothetical protein